MAEHFVACYQALEDKVSEQDRAIAKLKEDNRVLFGILDRFRDRSPPSLRKRSRSPPPPLRKRSRSPPRKVEPKDLFWVRFDHLEREKYDRETLFRALKKFGNIRTLYIDPSEDGELTTWAKVGFYEEKSQTKILNDRDAIGEEMDCIISKGQIPNNNKKYKP